jgi:hypothetical protein
MTASSLSPLEKAVDRGSPAALVARIPLLVLDVSQSGCLFESRRPVEAGHIGTVRLALNGHWYVDDVRITRCTAVPGRGSTYHVAAEFLRARGAQDQSLRFAIGQLISATLPSQDAPPPSNGRPAHGTSP